MKNGRTHLAHKAGQAGYMEGSGDRGKGAAALSRASRWFKSAARLRAEVLRSVRRDCRGEEMACLSPAILATCSVRQEAFKLIRQFESGSSEGYLFHFTNVRGAEGILKEGRLRASVRGVGGPGFYAGKGKRSTKCPFFDRGSPGLVASFPGQRPQLVQAGGRPGGEHLE